MDSQRPTPADFPAPAPFDPWASPSSLDFPDAWSDPAEERARLRRRFRRLGLGFASLNLGLVVASISSMGFLFLLFLRMLGLGFVAMPPAFERVDLIISSVVVWASCLGAALIWSPWPDRSWLRRSGLFLLMCLVDVVLWSLDNAAPLGLTDGGVGHEWFRQCLGQALGWSEFALIASLSADMAARMGEPQALEFGRAVRSLATTGAMVWGMYFYSVTNWDDPFWPLRMAPFNIRSSLMLMVGKDLLWTVCLVQATILSITAGRAVGRELRRLAAEDDAEGGWDHPAFRSPGEGPRNG